MLQVDWRFWGVLALLVVAPLVARELPGTLGLVVLMPVLALLVLTLASGSRGD